MPEYCKCPPEQAWCWLEFCPRDMALRDAAEKRKAAEEAERAKVPYGWRVTPPMLWN